MGKIVLKVVTFDFETKKYLQKFILSEEQSWRCLKISIDNNSPDDKSLPRFFTLVKLIIDENQPVSNLRRLCC
jgi:hypothetical protein